MTGMYDPIADLTVILSGARALAHRVWEAGWRPARCACCHQPLDPFPRSWRDVPPADERTCGACLLVIDTMTLFTQQEHIPGFEDAA